MAEAFATVARREADAGGAGFAETTAGAPALPFALDVPFSIVRCMREEEEEEVSTDAARGAVAKRGPTVARGTAPRAARL